MSKMEKVENFMENVGFRYHLIMVRINYKIMRRALKMRRKHNLKATKYMEALGFPVENIDDWKRAGLGLN